MNSDARPLFETRISFHTLGSHPSDKISFRWCEVPWPFAKIYFYCTHLKITLFGIEYRHLNYDKIVYLQKEWFWIKIHHRKSNIGPIYVSGLFPSSFYKRITEVI